MTPGTTTTSSFRQWVQGVKPLPGGVLVRVTILVLAVAWAGFVVVSGAVDLASAQGWAMLALAFLPLIALSAGVVAALGVWVLALVVFVVLGSPAEAVPLMVLPGVVLVGMASWLLPWKSGITVSMVMCGALLGLYLGADVEDDPVLIVALVAMVVVVVLYRPYELYRQRYEKSAAQVRDLEERQERVRREERLRLAHELHDIVAHEVTVIAMQSRRNELVGDLSEKASEINRGIGDAAQQTLYDLRRLVLLLKDDDATTTTTAVGSGDAGAEGVGELSGETTDAVALEHDLGQVVDAVRGAGFTVRLDIAGDVGQVPLSVRQALRGTIRELGTNVLKHADRSEPVEIVMNVTEDQVSLRSANTPAGVRPIVSSNTGLEAMRARCEVFGGSVTAEAKGGTWTTSVVLPLRPAEAGSVFPVSPPVAGRRGAS